MSALAQEVLESDGTQLAAVRKRIDKEVAEVGEYVNAEVAEAVWGDLSLSEKLEAGRAGFVGYVSDYLRHKRQTLLSQVLLETHERAGQPTSAKWDKVRELSEAGILDATWPVEGVYKRLGDCCLDDLAFIRDSYADRAKENRRYQRTFTKLIEAFGETKANRVSDLPIEKVNEIFNV